MNLFKNISTLNTHEIIKITTFHIKFILTMNFNFNLILLFINAIYNYIFTYFTFLNSSYRFNDDHILFHLKSSII